MALDIERTTDRAIENLGGLKGFDEQKEIARNNITAIVKAVIDEIVECGEVYVPDDSNGDSNPVGSIS